MRGDFLVLEAKFRFMSLVLNTVGWNVTGVLDFNTTGVLVLGSGTGVFVFKAFPGVTNNADLVSFLDDFSYEKYQKYKVLCLLNHSITLCEYFWHYLCPFHS